MNIYEKIAAVMQDVQYLAKDDHVKFGQTSYKALSEEKVTSIMRAEMLKHKLVVFPIRQEASRNGTITHVDVVYRIVNVDDPEEYIEVASCGDGADTQDKGSGKAMTYAFKYMWLRTFALPTGEDPDKISSAELDAKQELEKKPMEVIYCQDCGLPITATVKKDGSIWDGADIAKYSTGRLGRSLCAKCIKAALKQEK